MQGSTGSGKAAKSSLKGMAAHKSGGTRDYRRGREGG